MEMWKTRTNPGHLPRCAAFHLAQRARSAAAIRLRAAADMVLRFPGAWAGPRLLAFPRDRRGRSAPSALHPTIRFSPAVDQVLALTAGLPGSSSTLILLGLEL